MLGSDIKARSRKPKGNQGYGQRSLKFTHTNLLQLPPSGKEKKRRTKRRGKRREGSGEEGGEDRGRRKIKGKDEDGREKRRGIERKLRFPFQTLIFNFENLGICIITNQI